MCNFTFIGQLGLETIDIWRCDEHKYNFFYARGEQPLHCARDPQHCAHIGVTNDGVALRCRDCGELFRTLSEVAESAARNTRH